MTAMLRCTNGTISASGRHDFFLHGAFLHDSSYTNGTNGTISAKRKARFLPARKIRFPQAEDTIPLRVIKYRAVDLSTSCYSCPKRIVLSTCRHRIIRALRPRRNRVVDLSTSYHSCPSCTKNRVIDLSISCYSCHSCIVESHGKQHYIGNNQKSPRRSVVGFLRY